MNEDGHRQALEELRAARARLLRDQDIRAYAEVSFGIGFQLVCIGAQRRYGTHRENHEGLRRWLGGQGHPDMAELWGRLEDFRIGRWYGRQGNGDAADAIDQLLDRIEAWAMAEGSH